MFSTDIDVMQRAIRIARTGHGLVEPNPMVGAVIVDGERNLIAEGYHQKFGEAHAEINAIRLAGKATRGADLFVTLATLVVTSRQAGRGSRDDLVNHKNMANYKRK